MNKNVVKFFSVLLGLLIALALMTGCDKNESAPSLDRNGLMALVFEGWQSGEGKTIVFPPNLKIDLKELNTPSMDLRPLHVIRLSNDRAVLLVAAEPVSAGHSSRAALGAYWFKQIGQNWSLDQRQDEAAWIGSFGHFDVSKVLDLAPGKFGLIVESTSSGMGQETTFANLFAVTEHSVTPLLKDPDHLLLSTVVKLGTDCDKLIKQNPGTVKRFRHDDSDFPIHDCFTLSTKWQLRKGAVEPGDITLNSVAKMVVHRLLKTVSEYENSFTTFEQKTSVMRGTEVYRFDPRKEKYTLVSGQSVMPDWARQY